MINGFDVFVLLGSLTGCGLGAMRGFSRQMVSWAVWIFGVFYIYTHANSLSEWGPILSWKMSLGVWFFWILFAFFCFIVLWIVVKIGQNMVLKVVTKLKIRGLDRFLGFIVGGVQAFFLAYIMVYLFDFSEQHGFFNKPEALEKSKAVVLIKASSREKVKEKMTHAKVQVDQSLSWLKEGAMNKFY